MRFFSSPLFWTTFLWKAGDGTYNYLPQIKGKMQGFIFQIFPEIIHPDEVHGWKKLKQPESSHQHILVKRVNKTSQQANKQEGYQTCD